MFRTLLDHWIKHFAQVRRSDSLPSGIDLQHGWRQNIAAKPSGIWGRPMLQHTMLQMLLQSQQICFACIYNSAHIMPNSAHMSHDAPPSNMQEASTTCSWPHAQATCKGVFPARFTASTGDRALRMIPNWLNWESLYWNLKLNWEIRNCNDKFQDEAF